MKIFKNIKLAVAALLVSVTSSCIVDSPSGDVADSSSLVYFTSGLMSSYMLDPVRRLFDLLSLDEYLKLPESQQKESKWYNMVYHKDDNTLYVTGIGTLHTGGKTLTDPDTIWILNATGSYGSIALTIEVKPLSGGVWGLQSSGGDNNKKVKSELTVSELSSEEKLQFCNISCSGSQIEEEYVTEFSTGGEKFVFDNRFEPFALYLSGQFNVNIFKGDNMIDYCYMTYSGSMTNSITSRD